MSVARTFTRNFSRSLRLKRTGVPTWLTQCPEPNCECQPTPPGLDIDHESAMTFSPYNEHIVVCTGKNDWTSKIELDLKTGPVTRHLKTLFGPPGKRASKKSEKIPAGRYHDAYSPHIITNASFQSSSSGQSTNKEAQDDLPSQPTSLYMFPSFQYLTIPAASDYESFVSDLDTMFSNFIQKGRRSNSIEAMQPSQQERLSPSAISEVVVLICGHGGRDSRCGALGLPIQKEFTDKLRQMGISTLTEQRPSHVGPSSASVGLISHIGGHKWAGNVIIYIPPTWCAPGADEDVGHSLRGSAIWYGRVEPRHVEGIVSETILKGRLIKELWRGGMQVGVDGIGDKSWDSI